MVEGRPIKGVRAVGVKRSSSVWIKGAERGREGEGGGTESGSSAHCSRGAPPKRG